MVPDSTVFQWHTLVQLISKPIRCADSALNSDAIMERQVTRCLLRHLHTVECTSDSLSSTESDFMPLCLPRPADLKGSSIQQQQKMP